MAAKPDPVCRCGHARGSHQLARAGCRSCGCAVYQSALPTLDLLPPGVAHIKHYPAAGYDLVACFHADEHRDRDLCRFCLATASRTKSFTLPVQRLAYVDERARTGQPALF